MEAKGRDHVAIHVSCRILGQPSANYYAIQDFRAAQIYTDRRLEFSVAWHSLDFRSRPLRVAAAVPLIAGALTSNVSETAPDFEGPVGPGPWLKLQLCTKKV
jgi:hypothetical protein